jgi:aspartate-semialdehyde dehydrogenase
VEIEPRKMLGTLRNGEIELASVKLSAHTNRVAVSDSHLVCVSLELERKASVEEVRTALSSFVAPEPVRGLPSAPQPAIEVRLEDDRPQPRRDRQTGGGMTAVVGRVRPDPLLDIKFAVLSHNTIRGAAGGALLNGELLVAQKYIAAE